MKSTLPFMSAALVLFASACAPEPTEPPEDAAIDEVTAEPTSSPAPGPMSSEAFKPKMAEDEIPASMRGRWGLVAADCTGDPAIAKGLMVVGEDSLKFYESMAKLSAIDALDASRIKAAYEFSGEGETWTQTVDLVLQPGGSTLIRQDSGPDAMPDRLVYSQCE